MNSKNSNAAASQREDALHVGSPVWIPYLGAQVPVTITAIIVHTDGRLYATCMDVSGNERGWISLEELTPR